MPNIMRAGSRGRYELAALGAKYRRGHAFMHDEGDGVPRPWVRWIGPEEMVYDVPDPEALPQPLREIVRCQQRAYWDLCCPLCDVRAVWLTVENALRAGAFAQVVTLKREEDGRVDDATVAVVIPHRPDCLASADAVEQALAAGLN